MKMFGFTRSKRRRGAVAVLASAALALTGCSGAATSGASGSTGDVRVAFIGTKIVSFQPALYKGLASVKGIKADFIEVGFDEQKQAQAIDDAVGSGKYQGIVTLPNSPTGLLSSAKRAIKAGVQFINLEAQFGPDRLSVKAQVPGQAASIVTRYDDYATLQWETALKYCAEKSIAVCKVARIDGLPQFATATLFKQADTAAAKKAGSKAEMIPTLFAGGFDSTVGLKAGQDLLTAHPDVNVILSSDPVMQGVEKAVGNKDIALIGLAGTNYALNQVRAGKWYGDVALFPITAGELAGEAMLRHVKDPSLAPETISPLPKDLGPMFTKENIDTYKGQYD